MTTYEIQNRLNNTWIKHSYDYQKLKQKTNSYITMTDKEFIEVLEDRSLIGELMHHASFVLWIKDKPVYEYRETLGDYGLIHLLIHCVETVGEIEKRYKTIRELIKKDLILS